VNSALRQGSALLMMVGMAACTPPDPPVLPPAAGPAAVAPAREAADRDDAHAQRPLEADAAGEEAPAVVSVALDHAGDVLVGQRFSAADVTEAWHSAGLADGLGSGACDYYERGSLPEGVSMMVEDDHVQRFDLDPIDGSYDAIAQPGPFGIRLGMSRAQALALLPPGSTSRPHAYDPEVGEYVTWQDPGSDLAIRLEIFGGEITKLYWGASGAVELIEGCA